MPVLAIALLAQTSAAFADTTIGTTSPVNAPIYTFGIFETPSYGESFLSPGGVLSSFTFSSITVTGGSDVLLVIAALNGTTPDAPLYSAQYSMATGSNTFSNLGVSTTAGTEYIAYLTAFA